MDPTTVAPTVQAVADMPPEIAHTMGAAGAMAAIIRALIMLLKLPQLGSVWKKMPRWGRPAVLLGLTAIGFFVDSLVLGQVWYLAVGSALTALGAAVVSHEWQTILGEANTARKAKKKAKKDQAPPEGPLPPA